MNDGAKVQIFFEINDKMKEIIQNLFSFLSF